MGWALGGLWSGSGGSGQSAGKRRFSESDGVSGGKVIGTEEVGEGYRQMGARAVSLGFAQGKRRAPFVSRLEGGGTQEDGE